MQFQYGVTSSILIAGLIILYQALHAGVPTLEPVFLYESMMNYNIFGHGQLMGHPIYSMMKSAKQDQDGLVDKYSRGREN